jgi:hypothetical protein
MSVENAVPLHVDISRKAGRDSDLRFETVLQEYLRFSYKYFLSVLSFGCYSCKLCPSDTPEEEMKITGIKLC